MTVKVPYGPSVYQCLRAALGERPTHWKRSSAAGPPHISSADMLLCFLCFYGHRPLLLGDSSITRCDQFYPLAVSGATSWTRSIVLN